MAIVTTDNKYYAEIAAAIREKLGSTDLYTPAQMAAAILSISGGGSGLPDGYVELAYIQSSGTQYIDTGISGKTTVTAEFTVQATGSIENSPFISNAGESTMVMWYAFSGKFLARRGGSAYIYTIVSDNEKHDVKFLESTIEIDGQSFACAGTGSSRYNYFMFCESVNGVASTFSSYRLYTAKFYDNGTLVRDYVPCCNPYGVVGLFDLVNSQFYGNAGAGEFVGGAPVVEPTLPSGYTKLDYIQSSGTQYIDTSIIGKTGIKAVGKFRPLSLESCIALGCYGSQRFYMLSFDGSNIRYGYVDWHTATAAVSANTDYEFEVDFSAGKQHLKLNGTTYISSSNTTTFNNNRTLYAFAYNDNGPAGDFAKCRMYSLQLYDNGTLVRDFAPCINPSGAYGLYDMVNAQFYGNAGSGAFTGG